METGPTASEYLRRKMRNQRAIGLALLSIAGAWLAFWASQVVTGHNDNTSSTAMSAGIVVVIALAIWLPSIGYNMRRFQRFLDALQPRILRIRYRLFFGLTLIFDNGLVFRYWGGKNFGFVFRAIFDSGALQDHPSDSQVARAESAHMVARARGYVLGSRRKDALVPSIIELNKRIGVDEATVSLRAPRGPAAGGFQAMEYRPGVMDLDNGPAVRGNLDGILRHLTEWREAMLNQSPR